jgi:hypothetical protein
MESLPFCKVALLVKTRGAYGAGILREAMPVNGRIERQLVEDMNLSRSQSS